MSMERDVESKVVYVDSEGHTRAIRGVVAIRDGLVVVQRSNGSLTVPMHRLLLIERWDDPGARP